MPITLRSHLSFSLMIEWKFSGKEMVNKTPEEVGSRPSTLRAGYRLAAWATPSVLGVQGNTGGGGCAGSHL